MYSEVSSFKSETLSYLLVLLLFQDLKEHIVSHQQAFTGGPALINYCPKFRNALGSVWNRRGMKKEYVKSHTCASVPFTGVPGSCKRVTGT